ncbi:uncharacterized protein LOC107612088 [Arachis ipaensis]|uniref:uncharacterized protein LOC107612088 n=1 Tax=Arachis ipaensis TaxID=130454 RepID=UPI0007AFB101|nr:uncharacterized protein LOC107612088 [Arachis ipaensis]
MLNPPDAYLNGDLQETVYMQQPPSFPQGSPNQVCKLHKSIYGLKQAPRAWFTKLAATLSRFGFQNTRSDPSLFVRFTKTSTMYVLVYVDDILVTCNSDSEIVQLISQLNSIFALKDLGEFNFFLGIEATKTTSGSYILSQSKYIRDLLVRSKMHESHPMPTPMITSTKLSAHGSDVFDNPTHYRSIVGALQYATLTRPDIAYAVNKVSQYMHKPLLPHWKCVKRILRYLAGTIDQGLFFQSCTDLTLFAFADSDWGSDVDDRRSTTGFCVYLGTNLVSWASRKQHSVSKSSAEAEFRSIAAAKTDLRWILNLFTELRLQCSNTPVIYSDNISAVLLTANPILYNKTKHFDLDLHSVRERVNRNQLVVVHIPATDQVADLLTKPLSLPTFDRFKNKLRVLSKTTMSLRGGC